MRIGVCPVPQYLPSVLVRDLKPVRHVRGDPGWFVSVFFETNDGLRGGHTPSSCSRNFLRTPKVYRERTFQQFLYETINVSAVFVAIQAVFVSVRFVTI